MLTSLAIRDIVLIERLDLVFEPGLCVLTGETGAGKSTRWASLSAVGPIAIWCAAAPPRRA
jgi:DNA repair protein RecN (Recombination protein N)